MLEGQVGPSSSTSALPSSRERREHDQRVVQPELDQRPERRRRTPRLLSANGLPARVPRAMAPTPCSAHHTLGLASSRRLRPGQVHGLVGGRLVGHVGARHAPVRAVHVADREVEADQRTGRGARRAGVEEASQVGLLVGLPGQAEADVDRAGRRRPDGPGRRRGRRCRRRRWPARPASVAASSARPGTRIPTCTSRARRPGTGRAASGRAAPRSNGPAPRWSGCRAPRCRSGSSGRARRAPAASRTSGRRSRGPSPTGRSTGPSMCTATVYE